MKELDSKLLATIASVLTESPDVGDARVQVLNHLTKYLDLTHAADILDRHGALPDHTATLRQQASDHHSVATDLHTKVVGGSIKGSYDLAVQHHTNNLTSHVSGTYAKY